MNEITWTVVGTLAAVLTSFGFVPQVLKMWRSKSVGDVSVTTFFQFTAGVILWGLYGYSQRDPVIIGANVLTLVTLLAALSLYYRARIATAQRMILVTLRSAQELGADVVVAVQSSSHGLIKGVAEAGGDVSEVARDTVAGAIAGAKSLGMSAEEAAAAAATGAVEAAAEVGEDAVQAVRRGLEGAVSGIRVVVQGSGRVDARPEPPGLS